MQRFRVLIFWATATSAVISLSACVSNKGDQPASATAEPVAPSATTVETPGAMTIKGVGKVEHRQRPCTNRAGTSSHRQPSVAVGVEADIARGAKGKTRAVTEYDCDEERESK